MKPTCNARNVGVQPRCQRLTGHSGQHAARIMGGVVRWVDPYGTPTRHTLSLIRDAVVVTKTG